MNLKSFIKTSIMAAFMSASTLYSAAPVTVVTQFTTDNNGFEVKVAADNNNNALAVLSDNGVIEASFSANGSPFPAPTTISNGIGTKDQPDVAMDATGTGLVIWAGQNGTHGTVETAFFNNGAFSTPTPNPLDTVTGAIISPSVSMNGFGAGLAVWSEASAQHVVASFFDPTTRTWNGLTTIGTGGNGIVTGYSPNGHAVAVWAHFDIGISDINANTFNGSVWAGQITLDTEGTGFPDVGVDASGNAIAIWTSGIGTDNVVSRRFDGSTWAPAVTLSPTSGNVQGSTKIAVAPNGTAIAVWTDGSGNIVLDQFNGTQWGTATTIAQGSSPDVTMDDTGNALVGWVDNKDGEIFNALLPLGGVLGTPFVVTTLATTAQKLDLALSHNSNTGFDVWTEGGPESQNSFGATTIFPPAPPASLTVRPCRREFAMQEERLNIITFTPSPDPNVVAYFLRRNGVLIAIIPAAGPFEFIDRCRNNKHDTYTLTSVNAQGVESDPLTITL